MLNIGIKKQTQHPVIEVFGPTLQGEGMYIGQPVHFIRFGGCDYRCSWCDSKYAVDPREVKEHAEMLTDGQLVERIANLDGYADWIVFSGGNPALQHLEGLVHALHFAGYKVMVETQGTIWRPWLLLADHITVSPKPPSSGNVTTTEDIDTFRNHFYDRGSHRLSYKVVIFDPEQDWMYLRDLVAHIGKRYPTFVSVGNDVGVDDNVMLLHKLDTMQQVISSDADLCHIRCLPQMHVLLWGNARGV